MRIAPSRRTVWPFTYEFSIRLSAMCAKSSGWPSRFGCGTESASPCRMVEKGVRFVQLYSGGNKGGSVGWDAHGQCDRNHTIMAARVDKPIAGLLADLKSRGLLKDTLVVWGGEFGRTPFNEKGDGRGCCEQEKPAIRARVFRA